MPSSRILLVLIAAFLTLPLAHAQQPAADVLTRAYADLQQSHGASLRNTGTNCDSDPANPASRACSIGVWNYTGSAMNGEHTVDVTTLNVTGSGIDLGNFGGWSTRKLHADTLNSSVRGITEASSVFLHCHAIGDCIANYDYASADGGLAAQSDEGVGAYEAIVSQTHGYFHGIAPRTYNPGATLIDPTFVSGNPWTTDGTFLIDTSRDVLAATTSGPSFTLASSAMPSYHGAPLLNALPLATAVLPRTTSLCFAFSTGEAIVPPTNIPATATSPATFACTLQPIDHIYKAFPPAGTVCVVGDNYPEQATIAAAGALNPVTHIQTLTLNLRNPNRNLAVFLGGPCGRFFSFDADFDDNHARQLFPVFGSLTGTDLIYGDNIFGTIVGHTLPYPGMLARPATPNPIHLFHGAEVVGNRTATANPILEPNTMDIHIGDTLENPHFAHFGAKGISIVYTADTPCTPGTDCTALNVAYEGTGLTYGATAMKFRNGNPDTMYRAGDGTRTPPIWAEIGGPHSTYLDVQQAPQGAGPHGAGGVFINIAQPAGRAIEPYSLFHLGAGPTGIDSYVSFDPATGIIFTPRLATDALTVGKANGWTGNFQTGACTVTVHAGIIIRVTGC